MSLPEPDSRPKLRSTSAQGTIKLCGRNARSCQQQRAARGAATYVHQWYDSARKMERRMQSMRRAVHNRAKGPRTSNGPTKDQSETGASADARGPGNPSGELGASDSVAARAGQDDRRGVGDHRRG